MKIPICINCYEKHGLKGAWLDRGPFGSVIIKGCCYVCGAPRLCEPVDEEEIVKEKHYMNDDTTIRTRSLLLWHLACRIATLGVMFAGAVLMVIAIAKIETVFDIPPTQLFVMGGILLILAKDLMKDD